MEDELEDQEWPPEKEKTWFFWAKGDEGWSVSFVLSGKSAADVFEEARSHVKSLSHNYAIQQMTRV